MIIWDGHGCLQGASVSSDSVDETHAHEKQQAPRVNEWCHFPEYEELNTLFKDKLKPSQ